MAEVTAVLGVSKQTIYTWRRQARIATGIEAGVTTSETAALATAKRPIHELKTELAIYRRANFGTRHEGQRVQ